MAVIKPFKAFRPQKGMECEIAALPYDVYSREEAREVVKDRPFSFLNIDRPETQFLADYDMYADEVYEKASAILANWINKGYFVQETDNVYYIYELIMGNRVQTGIVACASVDDYLNQTIKKHENTRADKELDRIRHVDTCSAQTGPIFLAYRKNEVIQHIISEYKKKEPLYHFDAEDGITHSVWVIDQKDAIADIENAFSQIHQIYIADGHHRCASAVKVSQKRREANPSYTGNEEFNYFLSVLFADEELMIMDYNRVIKDLNGLSSEKFLEKIKEVFDIVLEQKTPVKPMKKGQVSMYFEDIWYQLEMKETIKNPHPVDGLDVAILQNYILNPVLGIQDPKTDKRIDFVGGIRGLEELERRVHTDCKVAFAMYPTSIQELFAVADADLLMPPKSTWFEPKLRSGLFIHQIEK